jgi:hypothetical protein
VADAVGAAFRHGNRGAVGALGGSHLKRETFSHGVLDNREGSEGSQSL